MTVTGAHRAGSGTPLVLLHGFTDTWRTWSPVLADLEARHEVFAPTLPGHHGGPPIPPGIVFSLTGMVDLVEQLLDDAGLEAPHIAGNSLGGWLALQLAARGRASSVVALCPAGGWEPLGRDGRRILRYFQRNYVMLRYGTPMFRQIAARPRSRALAVRDVVAKPANISATNALAMFEGAAGCTIFREAIAAGRSGLGELEAIACPVRIAYGTRDRLIRWPACYERFSTLIPDAEVLALEGVGHLPHWDDPALIVRTILEVTGRVDAPEPQPART
jgi:pimeloyl-ACP methyl ester carboxylesterase